MTTLTPVSSTFSPLPRSTTSVVPSRLSTALSTTISWSFAVSDTQPIFWFLNEDRGRGLWLYTCQFLSFSNSSTFAYWTLLTNGILPSHPLRAASPLQQAWLAKGRGLPDPKPHAQSPQRVDRSSRSIATRQCADPPRRGYDQARRHRPLHPCARLQGPPPQIPQRHGRPRSPPPSYAHGWSS